MSLTRLPIADSQTVTDLSRNRDDATAEQKWGSPVGLVALRLRLSSPLSKCSRCAWSLPSDISGMSTIRVFVNAVIVDLPAGAVVAEAVRIFDAQLGEHIAEGLAYVTDGRGIEVDPAETLVSGAILRVVVRARRGVDADT
jgi:hypothetical protein